MTNVFGIVLLNSPGGSTPQWGAGRELLCLYTCQYCCRCCCYEYKKSVIQVLCRELYYRGFSLSQFYCFMWVQWSNGRVSDIVTERLRVRLTPGPLQATLSKLLTCCVPTQPPTLRGTGNEQQLRLRGGGLVQLIGTMVCLLASPWVQLSVNAGNGWPQCTAASLAHANQLPIPRLSNAAGHESDSCKWRYGRCPGLYLYLH